MRKSQTGQSTIEFILTFTFGLGVVFLFVNVAVNYSVGYVAHYATFMASRTYLTVESHNVSPESSHNLASTASLTTFRRFTSSLPSFPQGGILPPGGAEKGFHINPFTSATNAKDAIFVGAYAVFERPLSFFNSIGGNTITKLVSESYLGKEPVRADCWQRTCQAILIGIGATGSCSPTNGYDFTVFDNGC